MNASKGCHPTCNGSRTASSGQRNAADRLTDLRVPPGNKLEMLKGDRVGQYSIRIDRQWRICCAWTDKGPERVTIVDYH